MESIRIKNLRCLQDTEVIELRPITILLGQNSSGKSTFLRTFPLLRQTVEARTRSPLLWFGRLVDFGGFSEALSSKASREEISLSLRVGIPKLEPIGGGFYSDLYYTHRHFQSQAIPNIPAEIEVHIAHDSSSDTAFARAVDINLAGHEVSIAVSSLGSLDALVVNGRELKQFFSQQVAHSFGALSPVVRPLDCASPELAAAQPRYRGLPYAIFSLAKFVQKKMHGNTSFPTAMGLVRGLQFGSTDEILEQVKRKMGQRVYGAATWSDVSADFCQLRDFVVAAYLPSLLESLNDSLSTVCRSIRYIKPLRATADRFYRFQDLAVDEIDPEGQNLPMFIHALSITELSMFQKWTEEHFGFCIKPQRHAGHLSLLVVESGKKIHNLADSGFGYSQILPIATQLWWQSHNGTSKSNSPNRLRREGGILAMEQPELHLHPKLQAQVADTFAAAVKFAADQQIIGIKSNPFRIIAETHSEAVVNRLGELISKDKLKPSDVAVVLFERESPDAPTKVRCVGYNEKGYLNDWPYGFFDGR